MTGLTANVTAVGECEEAQFRNIGLTMCANLSRALSVDAVDIPPSTGLIVNLTAMAESGYCPNTCPFNTLTVILIELPDPCQYTVELVEVFKPINYTGATTITAIGPDVLTTCGKLGRRLTIGETYLAGVGDGCSPIEEWSRSQSFSTAELNLLRTANQNIMCGAMASVPSLLTLVLSVLLILLVAD